MRAVGMGPGLRSPQRKTTDMKALTIHQPWAWAIVAGHKKIENRTWRPPLRLIGKRIAIHAGKKRPCPNAQQAVRELAGPESMPNDLPLGVVVGHVLLTGFAAPLWNVVHHPDPFLTLSAVQDDPWFIGPIAWLLDEAVALDQPVPAKGRQGLWEWEGE